MTFKNSKTLILQERKRKEAKEKERSIYYILIASAIPLMQQKQLKLNLLTGKDRRVKNG